MLKFGSGCPMISDQLVDGIYAGINPLCSCYCSYYRIENAVVARLWNK